MYECGFNAGYSRETSWSVNLASPESVVWWGLGSIRGVGLMGLWLWSRPYGLCACERYGVCMLISMLRVWNRLLTVVGPLCDVCGCPLLSDCAL